MSFRITTNVSAINAQRNLVSSQRAIQKSLGQLASGNRINIAADDAAGLAISERFKANIRSTQQAIRNANDGISLVQTAEGGLNEISNIVIRLRELAMQAATDTVGNGERALINKEVEQLKKEIQRIATSTKWGTTNLLDGSTPQFDFQVGIFNNPEQDRITFNGKENNAQLSALGLTGLNFLSKKGAQEALTKLDMAIDKVNSIRANIGAIQNRLLSTVDNLKVLEENTQAANSRIRDTDMAAASSELVRNNILLQTSVATLAQANQTGSLVLKLIG